MSFNKDIGKINPTIVTPVAQATPRAVDKTDAANIKAIGESVVSLKQSAQGASLREDIEQDIQSYLSGPTAEEHTRAQERLPNAAENLALLDEQTGDFEDEDENGDSYADPLVQKAREEMASLSNAVEAGVITQSSLKIRVQARMRQYMSTAPAFAKNFRDITAQTLGDYKPSIDARHDRAVLSAKAAAADWKKTVEMGQKLFVDPKHQNNPALYKQKVSEAVQKKQTSISIKDQAAEAAHDLTIQQGVVRGGVFDVIDNDFYGARGFAARILEDTQMASVQKKQAIEDVKQQYIAEVKRFGIQGKTFGGTELDNMMEHNVARLDQYIAAIDNEEGIKSLEAQLKTDDLMQQIKWYANHPEARHLEFLSNKIGFKVDLANIPGGIAAYGSLMQSLAAQDMFNLGSLAPEPKSQQESDTLTGYYQLSAQFLNEYEPNDVIPPGMMKNIFEGPMRRWDAAQLPDDSHIQGFANFLSTNAGLRGLQTLEGANENINVDKIEFTMRRFASERLLPNLNKVMSEQFAKTDEDAIFTVGDFTEIKIDPETGLLAFAYNGDQGAPDFVPRAKGRIEYLNKEVATRYNSMVKAIANVTDPSAPNTQESSLSLYRAMMGE